MNKVYLIGNLTRDPEMRSTSTGIPVCNFSIAVNRRFKNAQTGQQETDFFNIVAWRQLAELCSRYLAKGRKVAVFGSIQTRSYEAQDGSKRTAFDIVADEGLDVVVDVDDSHEPVPVLSEIIQERGVLPEGAITIVRVVGW